MVFNGLKGAENAVYSYLTEIADLDQRIGLAEIADFTFYSYSQIQRAVASLEDSGYIRRRDYRDGWPHRFEICQVDIGVSL